MSENNKVPKKLKKIQDQLKESFSSSFEQSHMLVDRNTDQATAVLCSKYPTLIGHLKKDSWESHFPARSDVVEPAYLNPSEVERVEGVAWHLLETFFSTFQNIEEDSSNQCDDAIPWSAEEYYEIISQVVSESKNFDLFEKSLNDNIDDLYIEESIEIGREIENVEVNDSERAQKVTFRKTNTGSKIIYDCKYCDQCFMTSPELLDHDKDHEQPGGEFRCKQCDRHFRKLNYLEKHEETHPVCKDCGESFLNKLKLEKHLKVSHKPLYECDVCDKVFYREYNLRNHLYSHVWDFKKSICEFCKKHFNSDNGLSKHKAMKHSNET